MMDVFLTVDVEVWCDSWSRLDASFPDAFRRCVYGPTDRGEFGLRYQGSLLKDYGLTGVFFVEPLFSRRFGQHYLDEIVALLRQRAQEVQLHLHTEWIDEQPLPGITDGLGKRQFMRFFSAEEQRLLIVEGMRLMKLAGAESVNCFRAGSFGFNAATLDALAACGIPFDCSYNATAFGLDSGVATGTVLTDIYQERNVTEYPVTVYDTGLGRLRHAQLGACSWLELERLLWASLEAGRQSFVLLSHSFELLNRARTQRDPVVVERFRRLCKFLDKHRDVFNVRGFHGLAQRKTSPQPSPLVGSKWLTAKRNGQQILRRRYL